MRIVVLVDNHTIIDKYYLAEPALSLYIEDGDKKILFDTGYSDIFKRNAKDLGIELASINTIVFSHGHNDHTGGLQYLTDLTQPINIYCHPKIDNDKYYQGLDISMPMKFDKLSSNFTIHKSKEPIKVSNHLTFLGEIPRSIQPLVPLEDDLLLDDSALMYQDDRGIFVLTGCSHSGIINICEYCKKLSGKSNFIGVLGGFHLLDDPVQTNEVCEYFRKENIKEIYPCHCTDLKAKIELSKVVSISEIGVSSELII